MSRIYIQIRLAKLKESKFLTKRVFQRISENMSYEIFKYINSQDLLEIRVLNLGGYQLISNPYLRSRIKNYLKDKPYTSFTDFVNNNERINLLFEQTNLQTLKLNCINMNILFT